MLPYIVRRLLWMLPVLWGAATLVWILMFLIPGDPARILSGQSADADVLARVRAEWGLDQPAPVRYARFMGRLARLDLGTSYVQHRPVSVIVGEGLGRTFLLALCAAALALAIGVGAGLACAARPGSAVDQAARALTVLSLSTPTFWLGLILMLVFASWLRWLPVSGYGQGLAIGDFKLPGLRHLILPVLTLAIFSAATLTRVSRAALLEARAQGFSIAARARGLSTAQVLSRHALKAAGAPIATLAALSFGTLLGGAIATETVFTWPGLGSVILRALSVRDLPVVEGAVLAMTAIFLVINMLVDISYGMLDPRARHG
jgi:ABC-type dipeptide/oligopeptide/nickel transport system permease component